MNEQRLKKLVADLLREVLNCNTPGALPESVVRLRNKILWEARDENEDEVLRTAAKNAVEEIMQDAGTGDPEPTPQRPPQQPPQQYPGAQPTEDPYLEP